MADLSTLAADLRAKDEVAAKLTTELSRANAAVIDAERALFEAAMSCEPPMTKFEVGGITFALDVRTHYSCLAANRDALYEALVPIGLGGIFKTTFSVHAGTLDASMREIDDKGQLPEEVRELLSIYDEGKVKRPKVKLEVAR